MSGQYGKQSPLRPAQLIPRRIMSVTGIRSKLTGVTLAWLTKCHTCGKEQTFMLHQYHRAIQYTRSHDCYRKGQK